MLVSTLQIFLFSIYSAQEKRVMEIFFF